MAAKALLIRHLNFSFIRVFGYVSNEVRQHVPVSLSVRKSYRPSFYNCITLANYTTKTEDEISNKKTGAQKKPPPSPKISLFSMDESMTVVTLEEAQKLSKRRNLKLVKVSDSDTKHQRPVYKLLSDSQYLKEEKDVKNKGTGFKGAKLLSLTDKIGEHDLNARMKNILKWLEKNYEVRIVISGSSSDHSNCEKIYSDITAVLGSQGRIVQKRTKGSELRFQILPLKKEVKEE